MPFTVQPGEKEMLSVDARPSDAINLAVRCKVGCLSIWILLSENASNFIANFVGVLGANLCK